MDYKLLTMFKLLFEKISPKKFYYFATSLIPWAFLFSVIFIGYGLYLGLFRAPTDYQQGDAFRIIYVHVPSAWLSLFAYTSVFICSLISIIWKIKVFEVLSIASAKNGAMFTFLALVTGSIWGKPMWGTWWVWDARLTSMLVLFFFYLGYILLSNAFERKIDGSKSASVLAIIGVINLPIIKFSVDWWHTLHQPSSILRFEGPSIDNQMLLPLILMITGFSVFSLYIITINVKTKLIEKKCEALLLKSNLREFV